MTLQEDFAAAMQSYRHGAEDYAVKVVDAVLRFAQERRASDVHFIPARSQSRLEILLRLDGVLEVAGSLEGAGNVVSRLKVIAGLLTYRTDVPQEGRVKGDDGETEIRVSTFPTVNGEKAVVRLFVGSGKYLNLKDLGYAKDIEERLIARLQESSGLLLACGPAGAGKTTTLYACLREIQQWSQQRKSLCTLEDPVEAIVPGVSQSLIKPQSEFTYQRGLISLMRQDPDVIMVGEIRDPETAEVVFQASLTGHLVLSTFHAGTATDALGRLAEMGIQPYVLRSGLSAILSQRLLRRSCDCRSEEITHCVRCRGTGYFGRVVAAELLEITAPELIRSILEQQDVHSMAKIAIESGMIPMFARVQRMIEENITTMEECLRVFGPGVMDQKERIPAET